jgi:general secretion pathway protein M
VRWVLGAGPRRALALLILAAAAGLVVGAPVAGVWYWHRHYDSQITDLEDRLNRLRRVAANSEQLQRRYEELKQQVATDVYFLRGPSEALASAELQGIAKQEVAASGGNILSTQILPTRQESGFTRVAIKVRMRGSLAGVVTAFYRFESGRPYLFLDAVSIRNWAGGRVRIPGQPLAAGQAPQELDLDFELAGYVRGGGA